MFFVIFVWFLFIYWFGILIVFFFWIKDVISVFYILGGIFVFVFVVVFILLFLFRKRVWG